MVADNKKLFLQIEGRKKYTNTNIQNFTAYRKTKQQNVPIPTHNSIQNVPTCFILPRYKYL